VNATQKQPTWLIDLPDVEHSDLVRMLKRELFLALVPFLVLAVGSFIATRRLPPGSAFVLESRGIGIWYDILVTVVAVGFFAAFYMFPALWVRRSLSIVYRILIFLTFTCVLFAMEAERHIAVVQSGDTFTFVRRYPLGSVTVAAGEITTISTQTTKAFGQVRIEARTGGPRGQQNIVCQLVWARDQRTMQVMDELALALTKSRDASHKVVVPSTPAR